MAAMPISLNEQHKQPFGRDNRAVVWELLSGSDSVKDLASRQPNHETIHILLTFDIGGIAKVC